MKPQSQSCGSEYRSQNRLIDAQQFQGLQNLKLRQINALAWQSSGSHLSQSNHCDRCRTSTQNSLRLRRLRVGWIQSLVRGR